MLQPFVCFCMPYKMIRIKNFAGNCFVTVEQVRADVKLFVFRRLSFYKIAAFVDFICNKIKQKDKPGIMNSLQKKTL